MGTVEIVNLLKKCLEQLRSDASVRQFEGGTFSAWKGNVRAILFNGLGDSANLLLHQFDMATRGLPMPENIIHPGYDKPIFEHRFVQLLPNVEKTLENIIWQLETFGTPYVPPKGEEISPKAFISHGGESAALRKLREFLETLGIELLIVKEQPSLDQDLPDKVNLYLSQADFVIILATADDTVKDKITGKETKQPRQNVIHEIGLAQKTHSGKIIYLLEEGAEFPSNIRPKVWESFKQRNMMNAFLGVVRELRAYGMLKVAKPQEE
jgi:predicted nucleotide-binding protein